MASEEKVVTPVQTAEEPKTGVKNNFTIGIDISLDEVVKLDSEGKKLFFDSTPGNFLKVPDEVLSKLSRDAKLAYLEAERSNRRENEKKDLSPTPGLQVTAGMSAMATSRLEVDYPPGFLDKWHAVWKRPDEAPWFLGKGYTYVTEGDGVQSFSSKLFTAAETGGRHIVGQAGQVELVLMKCPKETYEAIIAENGRMSRMQDEGVEESTSAAIQDLHPDAKTFNPRNRPDLKF